MLCSVCYCVVGSNMNGGDSQAAQESPAPVRKTRRGGGGPLKIEDSSTHSNRDHDLQSPSTSQPQSFEFTASASATARHHKSPRNRAKPRFVKKSEVGSSSKKVGSLNEQVGSLSIGEKITEEQAKQGEKEIVDVGSEENGEDDALRRLEELQVAVEEPELSEEQLRINDQAQEDEWLAMESIFGDNVFILERQRGLRCFQIHIHIEAPGEIAISTKLNSSTDLDNTRSSSGDFSYSFTVQHLPPIMLTCSLPKSYPSHQPPYFILSVQWLDSIKISNLCSMLDLLWTDQQGQEVIYQWVDWLQSSSLSHLGFDDEIVLGPYGFKDGGDRRALTGSISPDADIPFLRSYNNERLHENFLNGLQECCICFSVYAGAEFITLPCKHFFCWKCMKSFSDMHVRDGTIAKLHCPDAKCKGMIPPGFLKRLLGDEEFERWESSVLVKTLESMPDVVNCPRCKTPCIEDEHDHAQCSNCLFSFCALCLERRHVGVQCMTQEKKLLILQERQRYGQLDDIQKQRERDMINEILSMREIHRDSKQCPSCHMAISRIEGCNKIACGNCGQYFCYKCGSRITGYDHFWDGACELFPVPQEAIQNREARNLEARRNREARMNLRREAWMNPRQIHAHRVAALVAQRVEVHGQLCPSCHQFNAKFNNNNHIACWACQHHFCYLCKETVRRSSQHYGPKGCQQHTPG